MLRALILALVVLQAAPKAKPPAPGPTAAETAKLYFLAGDVVKAQEWVRRGLKREPKTCGPMHKALAEYAFLANHLDEFDAAQAKSFFELDRQISPTVRSQLTDKAWARYVTRPLELARSRSHGDVPGALGLVDRVLAVDPQNVEALALKASLTAGSGDAGR